MHNYAIKKYLHLANKPIAKYLSTCWTSSSCRFSNAELAEIAETVEKVENAEMAAQMNYAFANVHFCSFSCSVRAKRR